MLKIDESVTHIASNVFVGSLEGAEDEELLERLGVSNILTVDTHKPRVSANMKWWVKRRYNNLLFISFYLSFMIEITDEETSDLLSHLDEAVQFIEGLTLIFHWIEFIYLSDCLGEAGGGVLVHCR